MEDKRKKQRRQYQVPGDLKWEMGKAGCALIREGKEYRKRKKECKIKIGISEKVKKYQAIIYLSKITCNMQFEYI